MIHQDRLNKFLIVGLVVKRFESLNLKSRPMYAMPGKAQVSRTKKRKTYYASARN